MGMHSLILDAQDKAIEAAISWHETEEAEALLARVDAMERQADRWFSDCPDAAAAFAEAATDARDDLYHLRYDAICTAAATYSSERAGDDWIDAWDAADEQAPSLDQVLQEARRSHAGDSYLERFAA